MGANQVSRQHRELVDDVVGLVLVLEDGREEVGLPVEGQDGEVAVDLGEVLALLQPRESFFFHFVHTKLVLPQAAQLEIN